MNSKDDMASNVTGMVPRGSRWSLRVLVPPDLVAAYGRNRMQFTLGTGDRAEAIIRAHEMRREWGLKFKAKRLELHPEALATITPEMAKTLAAGVRATVLADDDDLRSDLPLMAELAHARRELARRKDDARNVINLDRQGARVDDHTGLTPDEASMLALLNASQDGSAAIANAGRNLIGVSERLADCLP